MSTSVVRPSARITISRWPSERPLFFVALLVSLAIWLVTIVTVVGLVYALMFGVFFAIMHLVFVAHVRGNGVRLGPDQFPELHARVQQLAGQIGLDPVPEAYLMQAGGALNAFATRFLRRHLVVLFSDLLDACGDNNDARDMIVAHELGHVHAGHLRWRWLLLPASFVPFLGSALSRAREYTCDRYGRAGAGSTDGALLGLAILAAGGRQGPLVNRRALVAQRESLNTGLMTLGEWFSSHPPLAKRMLALEPSLAAGVTVRPTGALKAALVVGLVALPLVGGGILVASAMPEWMKQMQDQARTAGQVAGAGATTAAASIAAHAGLDSLGRYLEARRASGQQLPRDDEALYALYRAERDRDAPVDPFDGERFGYQADGDGKTYIVWSSGPDGRSGTDDDLNWRPGEGVTQGR